MKRKAMEKPANVAEILHGVLKNKGMAKKIDQYSVFSIWENIVGSTIAERATPSKMQGDTLIITTKNAGWAHELSFMKQEILKRIHEALPNATINDIRFIAGRP